MTISLQVSSAATGARLSALPLTGPLPQVPHLVAPQRARIGDFIGVFGGISHRPDLGTAPDIHIEVAYRRGVLGSENFFIDEMSDADAAVFKEITAVPFCGLDHHRIVRQAKMVEEGQPYQIHLAQYFETILYAHPDWLQGIWGQKPHHASSRPLIMMLEGAQSREEATCCLERTKRYMKLFLGGLPARIRSTLNLYLELPRPEDFLASGGSDHAFLR